MWLELHIMRAVLCALVVGKRNCHLNSSYNSVEGSHFKVLRLILLSSWKDSPHPGVSL